MHKKIAVMIAVFSMLILPMSVSADILGDDIQGVLNFGGYGTTNFWNPAIATVNLGSTPEFTYSDGFSYVNADFLPATLFAVQGLNAGAGGANSWDMYFTDLDQSFTSVLLSATNIPGLTMDWAGNTIHLSFPGGQLTSTWYANLCIQCQPVPEPFSLLLLGLGLCGIGAIRRIKK